MTNQTARRVISTIISVATLAASAAAGEIRWRSGSVSIPRKQASEIVPAIAEITRAGGVRHIIVQFDQPLTDADKVRLEASGVRLLDPLSDNAYFAAVNPERLNPAGIGAVVGFSRVAAVDVSWKLHPALAMGDVPEWAIMTPQKDEKAAVETRHADVLPADTVVAAYVKFQSDTALATDGVNMCLQYGANVKSKIEAVNTLVVELPFGMVAPLAAEDSVEWIEPPLPLLTPTNDGNRARTGANIVQAAPYNLNGSGVTVLVYDAGSVRTTHVDFQGRAVVGAGEPACVGIIDHSTHVSGTIGGAGVANPTFKGMAPGVHIVSHTLNQGGGCGLSQGFLYTDPCDMQTDYSEAINGHNAVLANNSIGTNTAPNGFPCSWEGDYGVTDTVIDAIVRGSASNSGAPMRIVWANGNERGSGACGTTYHTTAPPACAKNHITVGALNSNDDSITSFTSWGPADDDRLKPDVSGPGCQNGGDNGVTSCFSGSDTAYGVFCGTSMASPTVCGCSALLLQDYRVQFPARPDFRNSTLKILLAHTAVDLGNPGPDYQFGYGSIRIQPAVDFMRTGNFLENTVSQGGTYNVLVVVNPGNPVMKVTLAWDDPPGTPNVSPALVNDLDLVVFDPNNVQKFPWTLGGVANSSAPAVQTQKNAIDNIEQVLVNSPIPGVYRVEVRGFNVPQGPQPFSLCASPLLVNCSHAGSASLDKSKYACSSTATITVIDCDLNTNDNVVETTNVTIASTSEPGGETVTLTETGPQTAAFRGTINLSTVDSPGVLQVANGDTVTLTYIDADDGAGHTNVTVTATATVDCAPPVISNVQTTNIGARNATVTFNTDESAKGTVRWGTSCGSLPNSAAEAAFGTSHSIVMTNLSPNTNYFFAVDAVDVAGNSATDDNGGACYNFQTPNIPDLFTQIFPGSIDAANDLSNKSILFFPDAGVSHYAACTVGIVSLPTDPTGGTAITTWTGSGDDGYAAVSVSGGNTVKLHGVSYSSFFVGTNGYITFGSGDTTYTETLAAHFSQPRISGLFNDLEPASGGTVSYKQLADRVAVTWLNVPHYQASGVGPLNTLQIEMYFDGRITLSYLVVNDTDGLAGLSPGGGMPPDFFESDLSQEVSGCGPLPPVASSASASTPPNILIDISLVASDPNLDPLTYAIVSLPAHGKLRDPGNGYSVILSVPYTLVGGGNMVRYTPNSGYGGSDNFTWKANDGTFDSNIATESMVVSGPRTVYSFPMNTDPGWTTMGQWAWGQPLGLGGDPSSGFTGSNVYGYNLAGQYPNNLTPVQYLTTTAINCVGLTQVQLRFRRWLGVESSANDHANIQMSTNGASWTTVWDHSGSAVSEASWSLQTYNISSFADNQPKIYIRWGMGTTNGSVTFAGWNIDDVEIVAVAPALCNTVIPGDVNGDGHVDGLDLQDFTRVILNPGGATQQEICASDLYVDGLADNLDIPEMAGVLTTAP